MYLKIYVLGEDFDGDTYIIHIERKGKSFGMRLAEAIELHKQLTTILPGLIALAAPSNNGVQPTAELAGSEGIAAESENVRQPAAADA